MTEQAEWSMRDFANAIEILKPGDTPKDPAKPAWYTAATTESVAMFFQQVLYGLLKEEKLMRNQTSAGVRYIMTDAHRTNVLVRMEAERHEREQDGQ